MRKVKSNQYFYRPHPPSSKFNPRYHGPTGTHFSHHTHSTFTVSKRIPNNSSCIPGNHPLKIFLDFHFHCSHENNYSRNNSQSRCFSNTHHPIITKSKTHSISNHPNNYHFIQNPFLQSHSFHLDHSRSNNNISSFDSNSLTASTNHRHSQTTMSQSLDTIPLNNSIDHSRNAFELANHVETNWWQCSTKPVEPDSKTQPPLVSSRPLSASHKLRSNDERTQSFRNYVSRLSKLQLSFSSSSSSSILPTSSSITLNQNLKELLNDTNFQEDFRIIWSDLNSAEKPINYDRLKFEAIEFQRKSIDTLLSTLINLISALPRNSNPSEDARNKISIFNQVLEFLMFANQQKESNKVVSLLGLDPIKGWRNSVKQHLRIQTLKTLISFINLFIPSLSTWWSSEFTQAKDNPFQINKLAQIGIFLITALSKQGSVWKAFQLFRMMERLPRVDHALIQPISLRRRAATALGLVDALISRKKIDYANQVLETMSAGEWIGESIYRRYLLSMLIVKGALGELASVENIRLAFERSWASSNVVDPVAGRNKRARGFHAQDPRILVARAKIEAYGNLGQTRSAIQTFQETLRTVPAKLGTAQLPDLHAEIMRVHLKVDDPRSIEQLLTKMMTTRDPYGLNQPDQRHHNILLQAYANRGDVEGCSSALDRLLASGMRPDVYTYGNIALLFANVGEPDSIRQVIEALTESPNQSIKLNRELWNILLDAYIESGDWTRASKLLEYLELNDDRRKESDVVTNGSVLKALVVSGSPTDKVLETFKSMYNIKTGLTADERSYTLVLLSICDSGMMELAEAMFYALKDNVEAEKRDQRIRNLVKPNIFMYGVMISAFLRMGKPDVAEGYIREMQRSGIRPNLVIYSMLTSAYATSNLSKTNANSWNQNEHEDEDEEIQQDGVQVAYNMASQFRRELLEHEAHLKGRVGEKINDRIPKDSFYWGELSIMRKKLSHRLLGPIIQSYAKSARPAKALEMLQKLVSSLGSDSSMTGSDGKPIDIDILTMLMDGYRRAQDPVGVIEVWKEIFRLATNKNDSLDASEKLLNKVLCLIETDGHAVAEQKEIISHNKIKDLTAEQRQSRRANKLCLPLSIYTDCLSKHGFHEEIAKSWQEVQGSGFAFDAGNWNELCAAMFRSGNHRMGWWITERVFFAKELANTPEAGLETSEEDLKWAQLLNQTVGFRSVRAVLGLEGTKLDGAQKVESPMRPPNRTSIRKTSRFDDQSAIRKSFQSLLDQIKNSKTSSSMDNEIGGSPDLGTQTMRWSQQLDYISQARRDLEWKPYEKVFRMLHGSMWRECADMVMKKWEEVEAEKKPGNKEDTIQIEGGILREVEELMLKDVEQIVEGYELRYPQTMVEVMAMNESPDIPTRLDTKELYRWNKNDFIIRVIKRTIERVQEQYV